MSKPERLLLALFIAGLAIRIALIPTPGSGDISSYAKWGHNVQERGLAAAFDGVYFPIQYLIFSGTSHISSDLNVPFADLIKIVNLAFEIGLFALLVLLTRKYLEPWKIAALYWLNPFTLIIFNQGYVDAQFSFFILLSLWLILRRSDVKGALIAGIPLGIALLMKPQAIPIMIGLVLTGIMLLISKKGGWKSAGALLVGPAAFLILFSAYFGFALNIEGHKTLTSISAKAQSVGLPKGASDFIGNSTFLMAHYAHIPDIMPAINANMPNPWFFVAESRRSDNMPIYRVQDTMKFIGITYRMWGLLIFLAVLIYAIWKKAFVRGSLGEKLAFVICLAPILIPYLSTSAHENHFFLGFITLIILGSMLSDKTLICGAYVLSVINALNLLYLYIVPVYFGRIYGTDAKLFVAGASSLVFLALLYHFLRPKLAAPIS